MNKNLLLAYLSLTFITVCSFNIKAQSAEKIASESNVDPKATLLTIDKDPVTVAEFENIYKKNSTVNVEGAEKKDIEEYLQLFINYKLKVREAERLGLDTVKSFIKEFSNYRRQLAKPYLSDNDVTDGLIKEAYDRMNQEVRASHILIKVGMDASPEDTLKAYRKVLSIRKRLLRGEKFERVAVETSEDPSAKSNKGDLGYFTVFRMVYAFETAAYNTEVGKVSKPARTRFGYHLVKVIDKREAKGQIHVAHIMKKASVKMSPEERALAHKQIEDIYAKLLENGEFGKLASEQSDDKTSARKGGELPKFGTGRMVQEFEDAAFALKEDGDISKPVKTEYGWHIIKRISKKEIGTFDELKDGIKKRIAKDTRAMRSKDLFIDKIKKENNFKEHTSSKRELYRKIDDSALKGKWDVTVTDGMDKPIFEIGDVSYTQHDFAQYVNKNQVKRLAKSVDVLLKILYKRYVDKKCMEYEESQLEDKYPDFKTLMKEYWDGILLFELTDQKVWTMAVKDTTGLR
ncbi:peptidylprolyl isomerase, partial [Sphingobacteriaceae bacterium AH-315-L07]|nr:peptidylprolyl isomerase [Sphingobacteriaceae bacterium AH-315-L07]